MTYEEWQCPNGCFRIKVGDSIDPEMVGHTIDEEINQECFHCGEQMKQTGYVEKTEDSWTTTRVR